MKWSLEGSVAVGLSVAGATLIIIGVVQSHTIRAVVETDHWVAHTDRVLAEIEATFSLAESAETIARGYALTGQPNYLKSLREAVSGTWAHEKTVRELTADNPRQQRHLALLETLLARRLGLLDELAKLRRERGISAAAQFVAEGEGTQLMLSIRSTVQELRNEEGFLLKTRSQAADERTRNAQAVIVLGTLAGLLLVAIAGAAVHRDIRKRQLAERAALYEKHLLTTLMDNIPDTIFFKDLESRFTRINKANARKLGLMHPEEAVGRTDADFFSGDHALAALADDQKIIRSGQPIIGREEREVWPDRTESWVRTSKLPLRDADGNMVGTFGISSDITARKRDEQALEQANAKLTGWVAELEVRDRESIVLSEMGDLLQTCISEEEAHNVISQFTRKLFPEHSGALCLIKSSRNLVETTAFWGDAATSSGLFTPDQCWALRRGQLHAVGPAHVGPNCGHVRPDFSGSYLCVPMMAHGESLGILHLSCGGEVDSADPRVSSLAATIAERVGLALANLRLREALRAQSIRDPLTGLFNRRYMEESLEREIRRAERKNRPLAAIMIDLDHFKRFNDTFGHDAGDAVLREFGGLLRSRTRKEDIACRYGGEEFIVIVPDVELEDAYRRAEELREAVKHLAVSHRGQSFGTVTASIGLALFPEHARGADSLLRVADTALYQAKAQGRDRVIISSDVYA